MKRLVLIVILLSTVAFSIQRPTFTLSMSYPLQLTGGDSGLVVSYYDEFTYKGTIGIDGGAMWHLSSKLKLLTAFSYLGLNQNNFIDGIISSQQNIVLIDSTSYSGTNYSDIKSLRIKVGPEYLVSGSKMNLFLGGGIDFSLNTLSFNEPFYDPLEPYLFGVSPYIKILPSFSVNELFDVGLNFEYNVTFLEDSYGYLLPSSNNDNSYNVMHLLKMGVTLMI